MRLDPYYFAPSDSLNDALRRLTEHGTQILLVLDRVGKLLGTITDGDVRRALLQKVPLTAHATEFMHSRPLVASPEWSPQQALSVMRSKRIHHIPVIDAAGLLCGLFTEDSLLSQDQLPNTAVLMVGGLGSRLGELTRNCPKPMLQIGGKPILQTTIETLRDAGIRHFVLAVNYLASQIEEHFGDGTRFDVRIDYCFETEPLGTAGALRLLEVTSDAPMLVMNGDILTRVNYGHLLRYHVQNEAVATMCVREFNQQIPFGVVELDGHYIAKIQEKPTTRVFVNSGIYVLDPAVVHYVPTSGRFDMPTLFDVLKEQRKATIAYPVQEYWTDIGLPHDFQQAALEFATHFGNTPI